MPKATFIAQNGTHIEIEGTTKEVQDLLDYYLNKSGSSDKSVNVDDNDSNSDNPPKVIPKKTEPEELDFQNIINTIKTCDNAELFEKFVLDQPNEANRVLLPLFVIHKYFDDAFGLTTSEISKITVALGTKISRQNSLRALKFSANSLVLKSGNPPRYTLNRRGYIYFNNVLEGSKVANSPDNTISTNLTPKKSRNRKKSTTKKKSPKTLILDLINNGYFVGKKSLPDVQKKLKELGFSFIQPALSP
jgi:hypothetical protein